jgi:O-antigen/teichoic acid export membrane protein
MPVQPRVAGHEPVPEPAIVSVNRNVVANFAGGAWAALIGLVFVPFYVRLMGIESYGIVGILVSLQAMFAILDLGLSQTMSREMARLSVAPKNAPLMADTVRTLEVIYWCASVAVALGVFGLAEFISQQWLNPEQLSRATLREALWVMALVIGLRWPAALYIGAMIGLQRQVLLNAMLAVLSTVQGVGALAVLWYIEPTVQYFLLWQAAMALTQVALLRAVLYRCIRTPQRAVFRREIVLRLWRFAAGMTGIALVSMVLTQVDKILLSKLLNLVDFGYYVFATTAATALYALTTAVFGAYQPRLAALATQDDRSQLAAAYHRGCRTMAIAIVPAGAVLAFFSPELIALWTRDPNLVAHTSLLITLLVIGNVLHGLMHLPYALQLAFGWTRLAFVTNVISVAILLPAIYVSTYRWGAVGAAAVWIALNVGYVAISIQFMHRRLLSGEKHRWYIDDVIKPLAAVLPVVGLARLLVPAGLSTLWLALSLAIVSFAALSAALLSTGSISWTPRARAPFGDRG